MAHGHENLMQYRSSTPDERRKNASKAGKASGAARRRKAAMRETMNRILTMQAEVEGLSDILRADGGESTYEEIITMAIIEKAMRGDVKAYIAIRDTLGQTTKSEEDLEEQRARTAKEQAHANKLDREAKKSEGDTDEGVEIINDAPKEQETDSDFGDIDSEVFEDI